MIYDCFSFFNELNILEIRLNTLKDTVDKFVLVESSWTHAGNKKNYIFEENKARFHQFLDRIIHIKLTDTDLPISIVKDKSLHAAWIRENTQRNAIARGLISAKPNDIIIISDLDEIPSPAAIKEAVTNTTGVSHIMLRNYAFWLNNANISAPYHSHGPRILTIETFHDKLTYANIPYASYSPQEANQIPSATLIRFAPTTRNIHGGWHFSSQGNPTGIRTTLNSIAESSLTDKKYQDEKLIQQKIYSGKSMVSLVPERFIPEPLSHHFPPFITSNQSHYENQLLPATESSWRAAWFKRKQARFHRMFHDAVITILITIVPSAFHPFFRKIRKIINF